MGIKIDLKCEILVILVQKHFRGEAFFSIRSDKFIISMSGSSSSSKNHAKNGEGD